MNSKHGARPRRPVFAASSREEAGGPGARATGRGPGGRETAARNARQKICGPRGPPALPPGAGERAWDPAGRVYRHDTPGPARRSGSAQPARPGPAPRVVGLDVSESLEADSCNVPAQPRCHADSERRAALQSQWSPWPRPPARAVVLRARAGWNQRRALPLPPRHSLLALALLLGRGGLGRRRGS